MNYYKRIVFWIAVMLVNFNIVGQTIVWRAEAEAGDILGSAIVKQGCSNASGGEFVQIGNAKDNGIRFSSVHVPVEGEYQLVIDYFNDSYQVLDVFLNGILVKTVDVPKADWCYQGSAGVLNVPLNLMQGDYTIDLMVSNNTTAPLVDEVHLKSTFQIYLEPTNYYLSSTVGNDTNTGLSPEEAWESLAKISSHLLHPGDSVFFKSGDTFIGQLNISSSGNKDNLIYFGKYGDGDKPILDGSKATGGAYLATVMINDQQYIEIADLEICNERLVSRIGVPDELAYGIYVLNDGNEVMHQYHFHDLTIRDIFALTSEGQEFNAIKVAAIGFYSSKNMVSGNEKQIRDVLVEDCYITRTTRYGIHTGHGGGEVGIGNDTINRNMNMIFRNNHFYQTGGTCIMPGRVYNCLVENNIFDYPGSDVDERMAKRGSGAWYWSSQNVISQYNKSYHVRGSGDSYGQHIDFGNKNIILQYNYSEDSEGGFVEILGKNVNSVYRFNVSVNDGFRDKKGNSLWVSDYAGTGNKILSDSNYIYNNSIYVDADITPDISIVGKNTYVYNNIFYAKGNAKIGEQVTVQIAQGYELKMSNNLYQGNVNSILSNYDLNPVFGDPHFINPGELNVEAYRLAKDSKALNKGLSFPEPIFPMAGKGIFKDIPLYPNKDLFGNQVSLSTAVPHIGAFNGEAIDDVGITDFEILEPYSLIIFPNPIVDTGYMCFNAKLPGIVVFFIRDLQGRDLFSKRYMISQGDNKLEVMLPSDISNGIYVFTLQEKSFCISMLVVVR